MPTSAPDMVRPTLAPGQAVHVTGTGQGGDQVEATVLSVDAPRAVLRGRRLPAAEGSVIELSYSDGVALIHCDATVEAVAGRNVTVVLPDLARRIQRRSHARVGVDVPIVLLVPRPSGRASMQRGTTTDVSAGGAAVRMTHAPEPATRAPFVLRLDDELEVTGVAYVIDSDEERRDRHRVRLRFDQLRVSDREALASWVFRRQVERR